MCKKFINRLHLVLQISKIPSQIFFAKHVNTALTFTPLDNSGQSDSSNGVCTGTVTDEQSCDSAWTLKRILDLVVQFMPPPYFSSSSDSDIVYCYSAGTTTASFFQVQEINKGAIWSDACNTVLLTSMCERNRMMSPLFGLFWKVTNSVVSMS